MLSENDCRHPQHPMRHGLDLTPWGVAAGLPCSGHDDRLAGAQGALNRIQVWIGDLFVERAARRREAERAPDAGRAPIAGPSA